MGAEACFSLMCADRGESTDWDKAWPATVPDEEWPTLYRNHTRVFRRCLSAFGGLAEKDMKDLFHAAREFKVLTLKSPQEIQEELEALSVSDWKAAKEDAQALIAELNGFLFAELDSEEENLQFVSLNEQSIRESIELRFFLRVAFPCWLEFGLTAGHLMRRAQQGDMKALENLLRIDKGAVDDVRIRRRFHEVRMKNQLQYADMIAALKEPITKSITIARVKVSLAACISAHSHAMKSPLTEPDIRKLFDAVAADTNAGIIDIDLPESPEAFSQAILRHRKFWNFLFEPRQVFRGGLSG